MSVVIMSDLKIWCFILLAMMTLANVSSKHMSDDKHKSEHIAALYVKDGESGTLRFLGTTNNAAINQLITQKQDVLEALRPGATGSGTGAVVQPIIVNLGGTGTGPGTGPGTVTSPTGTTAPTGPTGTTGTTGTIPTGGGGIGGGPITNPSPIVGLLPQIVANGAFGGGNGQVNRRVNKRKRVIRRGGNRRPVKRRRGNRRPRPNNANKIYVIRSRSSNA